MFARVGFGGQGRQRGTQLGCNSCGLVKDGLMTAVEPIKIAPCNDGALDVDGKVISMSEKSHVKDVHSGRQNTTTQARSATQAQLLQGLCSAGPSLFLASPGCADRGATDKADEFPKFSAMFGGQRHI